MQQQTRYVVERASNRRDWQPVTMAYKNPRNADAFIRWARSRASVSLGERFRLVPVEH